MNNQALYQEEILPFQYFESLGDSILYDVYKVSKHPEVKKALEAVWKTLPAYRTLKYKRKACLTNLLCNLIRSLYHRKPIALSFNRNDYSPPKRYSAIYIKYDFLIPMVKEMYKLGWLEMKEGYYERKRSTGKCTRIWATEKLGNLFFSIDPANDITEDYHELVVLNKEVKCGKKSKKVYVDYKDTRFTNQLRSDLRKYNTFMNDVKVEYEPCYESKGENYREGNQNLSIIPFLKEYKPNNVTNIVNNVTNNSNITFPDYNVSNNDTFSLLRWIGAKRRLNSNLHCVFNRGKFSCGGRFYGAGNSYQYIKREKRKTITIDGKKTVELDFHAMHISMLYAEAGIQYNDDPYLAVINNEELRPLLKQLLLTMINAKTKGEAIKAFNWELYRLSNKDNLSPEEEKLLAAFRKYNLDIDRTVDDFKAVHSAIGDSFCSDAGVYLMNRDARIIRQVIMYFIGKEISCLPVHDSVITAEEHEEELKRVMEEAYSQEMNGFTCLVERK